MNEEIDVKQEADELTKRIVDRLGERQQKLEPMAAWERKGRRPARLHPLFATIAVAACIGLAVVFLPMLSTEQSLLDELDIPTPGLTEYRAATPELNEIAGLMEKEDFETALKRTETALHRSDASIKMLEEVAEDWGDDDAVRYDQDMERAVNSELRWTYIYLLIKQDRKKDAKKQLKVYLKYPEFCEHQAEAKALLEKI